MNPNLYSVSIKLFYFDDNNEDNIKKEFTKKKRKTRPLVKVSKARRTFQLNNMIPMTTGWGGIDKLTCGYTNGRQRRREKVATDKTMISDIHNEIGYELDKYLYY